MGWRRGAIARSFRDRDPEALERTMVRLPTHVAVPYVQDLPGTWRKAEGSSGRQLLASTLFDRIDVLGVQEATVHLSAHTVRHGLAPAPPVEVGILVSGRGERT